MPTSCFSIREDRLAVPRFILLVFLTFMFLGMSSVSAIPLITYLDSSNCSDTLSSGVTYMLSDNMSCSDTALTIDADNVIIDCNGSTINYSQGSFGYGVNVTGFNYTTIKNCSIVQGGTSSNAHAIYLSGANHSTITNNNITTYNNNTAGIYLDSSSSNNTLTNNTVTTYGSEDYSSGIYLLSSSNNTISGANTISTNGSYAAGIYLISTSSDNTISGTNTITTYGHDAYGIYFYSSSNNNTISGTNTITTNGSDATGISIESSSSNNIISGTNTITTYGSGDYPYGIYIDFSPNNTISGTNMITTYGSDAIGISFWYSSNGTLSGTNTITTNGTSAHGIYIGESPNSTISGANTITTNGANAYGIYLDHSDNSTISGTNTITTNGSGAHGVHILQSNSNNITSNNITAHNGAGFFLDQAANGFISGNRVTANGTGAGNGYGIYFISTSNNTVSGNTFTSLQSYAAYFGAFAINESIYDNILNGSSAPVGFIDISPNFWNTTNQSGPNIMGGPRIGGNFYANSSGTGFSETCADADWDGFCDSSYALNGTNNTDYLPLAPPPSPPSVCGNLTSANTVYNMTYDVNASDTCFTFAADNITLDCAGHTINYSQGLTDSAGINVSGHAFATIKNCIIVQGGNPPDPYGILLESSPNSTLTNNTITSVNGICVSLSSSSNSTIRNNILNSTDGYGVTLSDGSNSNTVSDNYIEASGTNVYSNIAGIYIESSSDNNAATGNNLTITDGFGVYITDSSVNNTLSGNNITASGSNVAGLYLESSSDNTTFSSNTVSSDYGVYLLESSNNTLNDNNVTGDSAGLFLDSDAYYNTFSRNTITGDYGIYAQFGSNATFIDNNVTGDGISAYLYFFDNSMFSGNNLTSDSNYGVRMDYSDYGNFTGNRIETGAGSSASSILMTSSTNNSFSGNYFTNTGDDGTGIRIGAFAGTFHVRQLTDAGWMEVYKHRFGVGYSTENFSVDAIDGSVKLRIVQKNVSFGDVDQIRLEACGEALTPEYARYVDTNESVLDDISSIDSNVAIAHEKEIEVSWNMPESCEQKATVSLTANEYVAGLPFSFNGNYSMGSNPGSITVDGAISEVDGTAPSYSPYWIPSSGHPSGYAYMYIKDDSQNVYFSLDATGDNTDEQGQDWTELIIRGKTFRIDDSNDTWGRCGFGLTSKVAYNHQTCEFSIPKSDIGNGDFGFTLRYYGTYSVLPSIDNSFFNNMINATYPVSVSDSSYANSWNTTLSLGTNIVGGPYLGGNYYTGPFTGNFSDSCTDANRDGICDSNNTLDDSNVDFLPITLLPSYAEPINATASDEYDGSDCIGAIDGNDGLWCAVDIMKRSTFECDDISSAHAFAESDGSTVDSEQISDHWVDATFANISAHAVNVWETNGVDEINGGFVTRIDIVSPDGTNTTVWRRDLNGSDNAVCAQSPLTVEFGSLVVKDVIVYVDTDTAIDTYEEIDLISLSPDIPSITSIGATASGSTVTLSVTTDIAAECRFSTVNTSFFNMTEMSSTNSTSHSNAVTFSSSTSGTYYVICRGMAGDLINASNSTAFSVTVGGGVPYSSSTLCTPSWSCTAFSTCSVSGVQTRTCTDSNSCGTSSGKPSETQTCVYALPCSESWRCTDFSACSASGQQTRVCTDSHGCGTFNSKPSEIQSCTYIAPISPINPAPEINVTGGETVVTIPLVNAGETETLTMPSQTTVDTGVTSVVLYTNGALTNATLTIKTVEAPQNITAPNDTVIVYLNITAENINGKIDRAVINFQVGKSKVSNVSNVRLAHYINGGWVTLPTTYVGETFTDYKFQAETTGFSTFAVIEQAVSTTPATGQPPVISPPTQQPAAGGPNFGLIALILIILAVIAYWWYSTQNPLAKKR